MLSVRDVRTRIVDAVAGDDWHLSNHTYEGLEDGGVEDGAQLSHRAFAVGVPSTTWLTGRSGGPRRSVGQAAVTSIGVRWLYRLRVQAHDADMSSALDAEAALLQAVLRTPPKPDFVLAVSGAAFRRALGSSTGPMLFGEITFAAHHTLDMGG